MSYTAEEFLKRLMNGGAQSLAASSIDHLLLMSITDVIDAKLLLRILNPIVAATISQELFRARMVHKWQLLQARPPSGNIESHIPHPVLHQLREDIQVAATLDRDFVFELMNHSAVESVFRSVLNETLLGFTEGLKQMGTRAAPKSVGRGIGRLRSMGDRVLRETPLSGFTQMLEQQAQNRINTYLDQSISQIIESSVGHLCDPRNAESHLAFQQHALEVFLSRDLEAVVNDMAGVVSSDSINNWMQLAADLFTDPVLQEHLERWLEYQLGQVSGISVADFLIESGVDVSGTDLDEIKAATTDVITSAMLSYLHSEEGKAWVKRLFD